MKLNKVVYIIISKVLDIIYPIEEKCLICQDDNFVELCPKCKSNIKKVNEFKQILSVGYYCGTLKSLILKFKYNKSFLSGKVLAKLLIDFIKENNIKADFICYVPISKKSKEKRGFNQCEILAKHISFNLDIPIFKNLKKIKETKEQKKLSKAERATNVIDAFKVVKKGSLSGKTIILLDDVVTTGATILECKKVLSESKVKEIILLTIAKTSI